ncbi:MAG: rhomboid family intramembrane serine protease [Marinilabiliales bacterium]|nr:MAG: rhomboid family intramembrane serine protease [Marinilabiliales bacterium]
MIAGRYGGIPLVVKNLLIINIIMLLADFVMSSTFDVQLTRILGLYYFESEYFRPYQIITHMFMHGGLAHLFFNMFALWMFGRVLETVWGSKRFLVYYLVTGLGAAILHTFVNYLEISSMVNAARAFINTPSPDLFQAFINDHITRPNRQVYDFITSWSYDPNNQSYISQAVTMVENSVRHKMNIPTVGASGAVFGVLLAFGMLFPNTKLMLLFPPIPIKAKYFVIAYGCIELYLGLTRPGSNIAHFAHLGGMIFGFILIKYWQKNTRNFY